MDIISMLQKVYVDNKSIKDCWLLKQMIEILTGLGVIILFFCIGYLIGRWLMYEEDDDFFDILGMGSIILLVSMVAIVLLCGVAYGIGCFILH